MAWRPYENLIEGKLDNTTPGKVTGWLRFVGMDEKVTIELEGDFHRDIRSTVVHLSNREPHDRNGSGGPEAGFYMQGFAPHQTGDVGDMTAGLEPADYVAYPYFEWYGEQNGRVVLELEADQVEVTGQPTPAEDQEQVSREKQYRN